MNTPGGEIPEEDIEALEFKLNWYLRYGNLPTTLHREKSQAREDYGAQYERYVGYLFESQGYQVTYHGLRSGREDGGVDLIAKAPRKIWLIQCKRWRIAVSKDVIARLHGATERFLWEERQGKPKKMRTSINGVLATSGSITSDAKELAKHWNILLMENLRYQPDPAIKAKRICSRGGYFLLPFDKKYDHITMQLRRGDCFFLSIREALANGFYYRPYHRRIVEELYRQRCNSPDRKAE